MTTQLMKPKEKTPEQLEAWHRKQAIWKHNSFLGHCQMARMNMLAIVQSETATDEAKNLAEDIAIMADELCAMLEKRR